MEMRKIFGEVIKSVDKHRTIDPKMIEDLSGEISKLSKITKTEANIEIKKHMSTVPEIRDIVDKASALEKGIATFQIQSPAKQKNALERFIDGLVGLVNSIGKWVKSLFEESKDQSKAEDRGQKQGSTAHRDRHSRDRHSDRGSHHR